MPEKYFVSTENRCDIVNPEVVNYMSVIIGVCGQNFATLWADKRILEYNGNKVSSVKDDATKIFQVNSNVLFGVAGSFRQSENMCGALSTLVSPKTASVKVCKDATLSFLKKNQRSDQVLFARNYFLAGKQCDGTFVMYTIHWDPAVGKIQTKQYYPYGDIETFGVALALPDTPMQFQQDCKDSANRLVLASKTYEDLDVGMTSLIREISKRNPAVSPMSMSLQVT